MKRVAGGGSALVVISLAAVLLGLLSVVLPAFTQVFVDRILIQQLDHWLHPLLFGLAIAIAAQLALTAVQRLTIARLSTWVALSQSAQFVWHLLRLPAEFFEARQTGDAAQRLEANDRIADFLGAQLGTIVLNIAVGVGTAVAMLSYEPALGLVGLSVGIASTLLLRLVGRRRADAAQRLRTDEAKLYSISLNGLQAMETLKAGGSEDEFFAKWSGYQARLLNVEQRLALIEAITSLAPQLLFGLTSLAILGLGSFKIIAGELSVGGLIAFQALFLSFSGAVQGLIDAAGQAQETKGDLWRLEDITATALDWRFVPPAGAVEQGPLRGGLTLEGVTFGYAPLGQPLIADFDLRLEPGDSVALVGGSGSGKSTLGRVASGLLQPWSGRVLIDGRPMADWDRDTLAASLAVVDQDIMLFEGTIRDNITLWNSLIPHAAVVEALRDVDLLDFVMTLPGTFDAPVKEGGANFSGGQRQRLELARALARNPRILILDEATSALDALSEVAVMEAIRRRRCTTIIIAHRLSTVRDCNEIIVLEGGKVRERGNHDALIQADGLYAALVRQE